MLKWTWIVRLMRRRRQRDLENLALEREIETKTHLGEGSGRGNRPFHELLEEKIIYLKLMLKLM